MADQTDRNEVVGLIAQTDGENGPTPTALVGIGVGVMSMPSLVTLVSELAAAAGVTCLIVVTHGDGLTVDAVTQALEGTTPLPLALARDGERLQPDHIYIGAPHDIVTVEDGHIRTRQAGGSGGQGGAFDTLLISLAEQANERAIAVILAGLGSEGSAGIVATKKSGGLSISEGPDHKELAAQGASDPAAVADMHLSADRIAAEIGRYIDNLRPAANGYREEEDMEARITQIATILRNVTSHDFHGYKRGTFVRRVRRRIQVLQLDGGVGAYVDRLKGDREEVQHLFQDLLIGVTQFFRDPAEFEALETELPRLVEGKGGDDQFRVWVLGCATGEEAYSIAILLRERMAELDHPPEVQIFATDLDARALSIARAGRYSDAIAGHIRPDRLERWFTREGDTYCVSKELREMCIFSPHNIVKDAPFSRIDILSCRNLLIYLNTELQDRVMPIFHFALRPGAVLFLGSSENVTRHQKLFAPIDRRSRVFRRLETATRIIPDFPLTPRLRAGASGPFQMARPPFEAHLSTAVGRQADAVADRYAPAYVIVDPHGDALHFSGRTGRYLEPSGGAATLNLVNLVHRDLRLDVRSALQRAVAEGRRIEVPRLAVRHDDRTFGVNLIVEPLSVGDITSLVVVFQDLGRMAEGEGAQVDRLSSDDHVRRLEAELKVTRDRLQATIEELESTNEELKSSNEEYQSINEELQSANEEMETSKEELQSVNEELQTVNGELAHRVSELGRTNSDLKNLLESTQIATVFLDNDMRVRNFTPAATEVFHLLDTDVGRPLDHVVSRVKYPELVTDVRRVLKTLVPFDREVEDESSGRHFAVRVLPYRSIDNFINGAVVTFTDLTAQLTVQAALRESEERFRAFVTTSGGSIYQTSPDWETMQFLSSRDSLFETTEPSSRWRDAYLSAEDRDLVDAAIAKAIANKTTFEIEHRMRSADGHFAWTHSRAVPIFGKDGAITEWFGVATDVTDLRLATRALQDAERRQQVLIEGMPQLVWRAADGGRWTWASSQWTDYTGQPAHESHGFGWLDPVHPDDRETARLSWARTEVAGEMDVEYRIRNAEDDSYRWFRSRAAPLQDEAGAIVEWVGTSTDVDVMRSLQKRQEVLVAELQHRVRNMLTVVRSVFAQTVAAGGELEDVADHFRGRLDALARTQVIVTRSAAGVVDLEDLIRDELLSVGANEGPRLRISGPSVGLAGKTAESIGLAIHELTTNALKYGALKTSTGSLQITWNIDIDQRRSRQLTIDWSEQGVPAVPTKPIREGFGRELIEEALPYRLGAETRLEFRGGGVRCSISVPLAADEEGDRTPEG